MKLPELPIENFITVDFETYWAPDYTLSKSTTVDYVRDPRFQVIGVGVQANSEPPTWFEAVEFRQWLNDNGAMFGFGKRFGPPSNAAILCHHTHFDGLILAHHFGVKPAFWLDTLSMGRALHGTEVGGSLKKLAKHYDIGVKGDDVMLTKGMRREDFSPEHWARYGEYCKNDVTLTHKLFDKMTAGGFPEEELWLIDTTIRFYTEPGFQVNEELLRKFHGMEQQRKADLLARISVLKEDLMSNEKFAVLLTELGESPPMKVSAAKSKKASTEAGEPVEVETFAFAKSDPGFQDLLNHEEDEIRWLAEARVGVKSTINETRAERFMKTGANGARFPVYLKYCGAHTSRWSGGDRVNFQNLPRVEYDKQGEMTKGHIRMSLLAPEGYSLVVVDSGQIEARVLGWVAEHDEILDIFRRNDALGEAGDFYSDVGSSFFGKKISKKETPLERQLSKNFVLGLGYGMGWYKFAMELAKGMLGSPPVKFTNVEVQKFGVNVPAFAIRQFKGQPSNAERVSEMPSRMPFEERIVHAAVSDYFVTLYRERNHHVPAFWNHMKEVIEVMLEDEANEPFGPGRCMRAVRHGIVMPNGLTMKYPGLGRSGKGFSYLGGHGGKQREKIYGGLATENVVQALARIIVGEQLLKIRFAAEPLGGRVLTTTHDEVVSLVPDAVADQFLDTCLGIMRTPSDWCLDLPLNASGGVAKAYGDAK